MTSKSEHDDFEISLFLSTHKANIISAAKLKCRRWFIFSRNTFQTRPFFLIMSRQPNTYRANQCTIGLSIALRISKITKVKGLDLVNFLAFIKLLPQHVLRILGSHFLIQQQMVVMGCCFSAALCYQ